MCEHSGEECPLPSAFSSCCNMGICKFWLPHPHNTWNILFIFSLCQWGVWGTEGPGTLSKAHNPDGAGIPHSGSLAGETVHEITASPGRAMEVLFCLFPGCLFPGWDVSVVSPVTSLSSTVARFHIYYQVLGLALVVHWLSFYHRHDWNVHCEEGRLRNVLTGA